MVSVEEVRELMRAWVNVSTLTPAQLQIVTAMRDVAEKGSVHELAFFATSMMHQFENDVIQAIIKARAEGLGAKKH